MNFEEYLEPKLLQNLEDAKKLVLDNKQPCGIIIDGSPGLSKTTTACMIASVIQPSFDPEKQLGQGTENFIKAYNYTIDGVRSKYKCCVFDEANDADKSGSLSRIQRILNQLLAATTRQEKVIIIVVLHRFYRLDNKFIDNSLIHLLIHLYSKVNDKYVKFKAFDIDTMLHMIYLIKKGKVNKLPKVYNKAYPNFGGRILAPPVEYCDMIETFSKKGKDLLRKKATRDILASNYYTVSVMASMLEVTKAQVNYYIKLKGYKKEFLRDKSGRIFYYDKELFAILKKLFVDLENDKQRKKDNRKDKVIKEE